MADLGLARVWLGPERRLPAHKSARARMIMRSKAKEEEGVRGGLLLLGLGLACLVTSSSSLHKSVHALMRT